MPDLTITSVGSQQVISELRTILDLSEQIQQEGGSVTGILGGTLSKGGLGGGILPKISGGGSARTIGQSIIDNRSREIDLLRVAHGLKSGGPLNMMRSQMRGLGGPRTAMTVAAGIFAIREVYDAYKSIRDWAKPTPEEATIDTARAKTWSKPSSLVKQGSVFGQQTMDEAAKISYQRNTSAWGAMDWSYNNKRAGAKELWLLYLRANQAYTRFTNKFLPEGWRAQESLTPDPMDPHRYLSSEVTRWQYDAPLHRRFFSSDQDWQRYYFKGLDVINQNKDNTSSIHNGLQKIYTNAVGEDVARNYPISTEDPSKKRPRFKPLHPRADPGGG